MLICLSVHFLSTSIGCFSLELYYIEVDYLVKFLDKLSKGSQDDIFSNEPDCCRRSLGERQDQMTSVGT